MTTLEIDAPTADEWAGDEPTRVGPPPPGLLEATRPRRERWYRHILHHQVDEHLAEGWLVAGAKPINEGHGLAVTVYRDDPPPDELPPGRVSSGHVVRHARARSIHR